MTALNPGGQNIAICHGHEKGKPPFVKKKAKISNIPTHGSVILTYQGA
jgi:hypothetical protein